MLILARKPKPNHDTIILNTSDGQIRVCITRVSNATVGVGIVAPESVRIIRGELGEPGKQSLPDSPVAA